MQPVQDLTIDSTVSRAPYHFMLEDANRHGIRHLGAETGAAAEPVAAAHRRRQRSAAARSGGLPRHRPRHRQPLRHYAGNGRQRALRRVRPAHRLDHLHAVEPVPRHSRSRPDAATIADRTVRALPAVIVLVDQRPGAAVGDHARRPARRAAADHPFRPVSGDDDLLQHRARLFARCRRRRDRKGGSRHRPADQLHHRVPGHRGGVPVVADQRTVPDHRRHGDDVYRARRALRELRPSDHDPLDAAVGGRRRAAVADAAALRPRRHRHHRHHPADRHRQEERAS